MPFHEHGPVRTWYEEVGAGFPLMVLPGGGLNAAIGSLTRSETGSPSSPFNPMVEFADEYRCIALDLRNSTHGQSTGPLDIERNWDAYTDDQLALMDHLGIDQFMVLGFCVGGPLIWNLLRRAPERVVAAVLAQPSGFNPDAPRIFYDNNMKNWGPPLSAGRDDISMDDVETFLAAMYLNRGDFVFTVDREFVRNCPTPVLVMPDDIPAHPFAMAMETAELAPQSQISLFPWKQPDSHVPIAVRHARSFLKAHTPASA
ncbi:MAG: alpha/beta hydrolase [Chloroflexi bacterium]|nr:alpha/beta hydrolase [Chloroflexota bacterium]